MSLDRRLLFVLLAAFVVAAPAAVMGALCVGNACRSEPPPADVPFCSLPGETRTLLSRGFRESRSPHVMAVTRPDPVVAGSDLVAGAPWPAVGDDAAVPLVFAGTGVHPGAEVPDGTILDAVAPTIAEVIGLRRPNPRVRTGEAVPGVASGERPRLVLEVVWRGVAASDLRRAPRRWPVLRGLLEDGAGTLAADIGSRPLDPGAVMATIGTGGLPSHHGITGTLVRNDEGTVVEAWSEEAPFSVIAALGDDLDELLGQRPRVGVVGTGLGDVGLIGRDWYVEHDRDDVVMARRPRGAVAAARDVLGSGYGTDADPDLLAVAMAGDVRDLDAALGELVAAADAASGGSVAVAVTSTGPMANADALTATRIVDQVESRAGASVVEAAAVGGLFLDQEALAAADVTDDRVVRALRAVPGPDGEPLFADVFPGLAVTFGRYC